MPFVDIPNLLTALEAPALMGLDVGEKSVGIAVSDATRTIASPRGVIARSTFSRDAEAVWAIADDHAVGGLVVGLPLHMNGQMSPRAQAARSFARNLMNQRDLPVIMWDERLSSMAAERAMLEADLSRAKRAARIDATAAALILQGALDRLKAPEL